VDLLFAVLPYIKTEKPFRIGKIVLRSSRDAEHLTQDEADHLVSIVSLFCLADDRPIEEMAYALLHLSDDRDQADLQIRELMAAHTVLTFLLSRDSLYDTYEQVALYAMSPREIYELGEGPLSPVPGYSVTINWMHWCEVARGKRLYPAEPFPLAIIPKGWYLSDLEYQLGSDILLTGFGEFLSGGLLRQPEQVERFDTLLRAMSWYNRSFSQFESEEQKIIHLAVAFEVLFHQKYSRGVREEIKAHLRGLFGEARRLADWVDQFYDERSRIVHEGFAARLRFAVGDTRPDDQQLIMDSLASYGRRILRMCIFTILQATLLAQEARLNAWFTHDQERLQEICKQLKDDAVPAEQRLRSTIDLVYDLGEVWVHYLHQESIELKTVHAAGRKLAQLHMEAYPEMESAIRQQLEHIANMELDPPLDLVWAYRDLSALLSKQFGTYKGQYWPRQPLQALAQFAKYAGSSGFQMQAATLPNRQPERT